MYDMGFEAVSYLSSEVRLDRKRRIRASRSRSCSQSLSSHVEGCWTGTLRVDKLSKLRRQSASLSAFIASG